MIEMGGHTHTEGERGGEREKGKERKEDEE